MKKLSIFNTILASVALLSSCNQIDTTLVPDPIGYDQEPIVGEMSMDGALKEVATAIDLNNDADGIVEVMTYVLNENVPQDAQLEHTIIISSTENFTDNLTTKIKGIDNNNAVSVSVADLDNAVKIVCGYEEVTFSVYMKLQTVVVDAENHHFLLASNAFQTAAITTTANLKEYFVVGDFSGWSQTNGQRLYSINAQPAQGWIVLNGVGGNGWKISTQENWDGINYGAGEEAADEAESILLSDDGGANNITCYKGFSYEVSFDPRALTLTILNTVSSWGLVGSFNDWGSSADVAMTLSSEDGMDYLVATTTLPAGAEYKIRANQDWGINYGDAGNGDGTLARDGANFSVSEEGNYEVRFYFCAQEPYLTITKL